MIEITWYDNKPLEGENEKFFNSLYDLGAMIFFMSGDFANTEKEKNDIKDFPFFRIKDSENTDPYSDTYNGVYMEFQDFKDYIEQVISYAK